LCYAEHLANEGLMTRAAARGLRTKHLVTTSPPKQRTTGKMVQPQPPKRCVSFFQMERRGAPTHAPRNQHEPKPPRGPRRVSLTVGSRTPPTTTSPRTVAGLCVALPPMPTRGATSTHAAACSRCGVTALPQAAPGPPHAAAPRTGRCWRKRPRCMLRANTPCMRNPQAPRPACPAPSRVHACQQRKDQS
jgi:hypothetical protein